MGFLSQAKIRYSTSDRELFVTYLAVIHVCHLIEGYYIVLFTIGKSLCTAFRYLTPAKSDCQQQYFSEYIADVTCIKDDQNIAEDCMSRPELVNQRDVC